MPGAPHLSHPLFATAAEHPGRLALADSGERLTYGEAAARIARIAGSLAGRGLAPGSPVALLLSRSALASCSFHAVLSAGLAAVPLPAGSPVERLRRSLAHLRPAAVLYDRSQAALASALERLDPARAYLAVEALSGSRVATPAAEVEAGAIAYVLSTSGSTGVPKGVVFDHGAAGLFPRWCLGRWDLGPDDRIAALAPLCFDLATLDLFAAPAAAAAVLVPPREALVFPRLLARWIEAERVSVLYAVPSLLLELAARGGLTPSLGRSVRAVLFAGEVFPPAPLARLARCFPRAILENLYGPTETNVCTAYRLPAPPRADDPPLPIGSPLPYFAVEVVADPAARGCDGGVGELVVHGPGVMRGYWGERLAAPGEPRRHATGDWVRPGTELHLLGRRDRVVKVRGHRVALAEVESAVLAHRAVVEAAVTLERAAGSAHPRLTAFYAARGTVGEGELRACCARALPSPMVPHAFVRLERLPRTATGKVALADLQCLAAARTA